MLDLLLFSKLFCNDENFIIRIEYDMKHKKVLDELSLKFNLYTNTLIDRINTITNISSCLDYEIHEYINDFKNKKYNENTKVGIIKIIKSLLRDIEYHHQTNYRIIFVILIFDLLDTEIGTTLLKLHPNFRNVVEIKIREFQSCDDINQKFSIYMNQNYETGKKYISVYKNKKYYKNLLKTVIFSLYTFYSLFKKVKNNKRNCILS